MNIPWKTIIWQQFGAAIDMLDEVLRACPDELWRARLWNDPAQEKFYLPEFWYVVYHTLFWLDLYLTGAEEGFTPPAPFMLVEQDENGPLPERAYTKAELQSYLEDCRKRCQATIESTTDEAAQRRCRFGWGEVSFAELLLYNMRHVQGHAAQLSLVLGQKVGPAPDWVARAHNRVD
jgi:DinB superfamily